MTKVLVFGRGEYFKSKIAVLRNTYEVVAFVDNNTESREMDEEWKKKPVLHPNELNGYSEYPILIMVSWKYINEIVFQLISNGINRDRIIISINEGWAVNDTESLLKKAGAKIYVIDDGLLRIKSSMFERTIASSEEFQKALFEIFERNDNAISCLRGLDVHNTVIAFGSNRGNPIDRYYIESFLLNNSKYIHGDVGEMGELTYTERFGKDLRRKYIFHVAQQGENIKNINLETGEGIEDELLDCFICTQTISFIYDIHSAIKNIRKLLKKDGVAIITVPGICKISMGDYEQWGDYWRFSKQSLLRLIEEEKFDLIDIASNGNIKTAICFLYGLTVEDLSVEDFSFDDEQFPVVVSATIRKK